MRRKVYAGSPETKGITVIRKNDGMLPLIDVLYCGYGGSKFTNGSKYNYWVIKATGRSGPANSRFTNASGRGREFSMTGGASSGRMKSSR